MSGFGDLEFGECGFGDGLGGATFRNLGFEQGTNGFAAEWETDHLSQDGEFAGFEDGEAAEGFEHGWSNTGYAFDLVGATAAGFSALVYESPISHEDFEQGWANTPYETTTFNAIAAIFNGDQWEDFESGWNNGAFLEEFTGGELTAAVFDGNDFENFEQSWRNTGYLFVFAGGLSAPSLSGQLAIAIEDFETVKEPQQFTASAATDVISTLGHGLSVDYRVVFATPIAGAMPTPIAPSVPYYVQAVPDADTFKLALVAAAGSPIDLTGDGSGLLRWSAPYEHWTTVLSTI